MLPGKIESYDADTQKADVRPMVLRSQNTADGELTEEIPVLPAVPVVFPRAGAFRVTFPINAGDRCVLVFSEQSIDNYQISQSDSPSDPELFQRHDLSDAIAIPGWYPDASALGATDSDDLSIGEEGGPVIHVGRDSVNIYEKDAADFVALAQKVLDELDAVKADLDAFKSTNESHTHAYVDTITGTPTPSITGIPASAPPPGLPITWPTPHTPASVAADKVKAT